jgi:cell pole-organizing protein PopZ
MSAMNASINSTPLEAERRSHEPSMEEILASIRRIIADDDALPVMRREREKEKDKRPPPPVEAPPKREEPARAAAPIPVSPPEPRRPVAAAAPVVAAPEPARTPVAAVEPAQQPAPAVEAAAPTQPEDLWLRGDIAPDDEIAEDEATDEQSRWALDAEDDDSDAENFDDAEEADEDLPATAQRDGEAEAESASPLVSPDAANSIASHFQALAASIVISESDLVERYARELLRPLLKQWLDDNLPHIVERLVRVEIERVARGRR